MTLSDPQQQRPAEASGSSSADSCENWVEGVLRGLADPLVVLASDILGLESRIDQLARDGRGQAVLVFRAEPGEDLCRLGDALAQRAWAAPRVADWVKLAPDLGLRPQLGVRVLLLASDFDARTRLAAESLGEAVVSLTELPAPGRPSRPEALQPRAEGPDPEAPRLASSFRTGLRLTDL